MQKMLAALSVAAGLGLICCQSAGAVPAAPTALENAATSASVLEQVQYAERRTRHGIVKCYRDLLIGPFRCHYYPGPL
jgi:hypothetical protein